MKGHHKHIENYKKRLVLTVTNDLVTDSRVHKVAKTLDEMGFDVTLVGRRFNNSLPLDERNYSTHRFKFCFNKGPLFYATYNLRLFFYLLLKNFDVVVSNDLDSLLAGYIATKITKKVLVYDSHEYFTEVPELVNRPFIKKRWEGIERAILPKLKHCYTVCQSIADVYKQKYGTNFKVVRNVPENFISTEFDPLFQPPFPTDKPIVIYQGAVNMGRGIEEAIMAMHHVEVARLVIVGVGDLYNHCNQLVVNEQLMDKVMLIGRIPFRKLRKLTPYATIGLSVEKNIGLNYYFALPNKLFDYIHSSVPVLASRLPEIERIVNTYKVGMLIDQITPGSIASGINEMLANEEKLELWRQNCLKAKGELCWEEEEKVLKEIYKNL
jgi:glycosyltransferase involved in cell wall biosynthesis